jgi:hypothetical protein
MAESKSIIENLMDHFIEMVNAELVKCVERKLKIREDNNILLEKLAQENELVEQALVSHFWFSYF